MLTRAGLLGLVAGVSLAAQFAAESAAAAEPLTIEQLYGTPVRSEPDLSPDGSHYVAVISEDAVERILVAPVAGSEPREIARFDDPEQRIRWVDWAKPDLVLVSLHERAGSLGIGVRPRRTRLFSVPASGGPPREYQRRGTRCSSLQGIASYAYGRVPDGGCTTEASQIQDEILQTLPDDPHEILIVYRNPLASVRRLNLETGRSRLIVRRLDTPDGFAADADGAVRVRVQLTEDEERLRARVSPEDPWRVVASHRTNEIGARASFLAFASDPRKLYVRARHAGRDALFALDIESGEKALVAARPASNLVGLRLTNGNRTLAAAYFDDESRALLDPAAVREQSLLDAALPNAHNDVVDESDRGSAIAVVASRGPSGLIRYLAYDRAGDKLTPLYAERGFAEAELTVPQQVGSSASLPLRAALTLPRGGAAPGAAAVLVHCGPSAIDVLGFDPDVQALASRGIAVLAIDVGGNALVEDEMLPWVQQLTAAVGDAAAWLVQRGIAAPERIGVAGSGFGGYAALNAAAQEPARFRAVAALSPVASLRAFAEESESYGMRTWPAWLRDRREFGRASSYREGLASALRAPLLLAHGQDAVYAHVSQSRALARALRRAGRAVAYTELARETDVPMRLASRARFYTEWVAFFERELAPPAPTES